MKKLLLFAIFLSCTTFSHAKFKTDYLTATSSLTVNGPIVATGTMRLGGILTNLDGTYSVTETNSSGGTYSAFVAGSVHDYTVIQATNGAGSNMFYSNMDGNYTWAHHANLPSSAVGQVGYACGLHGADESGLFEIVDSTNGIPINIYHNSSTNVSPLIQIQAETPYQNNLYPGGPTPAYSGSQVGPALSYKKRGLNQLVIDSSGAVQSYDPTGANYISMWDNGSAGIIQTVSGLPLQFLGSTGVYTWYASGLTKVATLSIDNVTANSTFTATTGDMFISSITATGRFSLPSYTLAQLKARIPKYLGEQYYCSDCTIPVCVSTGTANQYSFSGTATRTTVCQ